MNDNKSVAKNRKRTFCLNVTSYFQEYCSTASIHGVQYFSDKNRTIFERIFWLIFFGISLTACVLVILRTYEIWDENAIGVTISSRKTPLFDIPFPAVTICPTSQIPHYDCSTYNKSDIELMFKHRNYASVLCGMNKIDSFCPQIKFTKKFNDSLNDSSDFYDFMNKVKPMLFFFCTFNQNVVVCAFEEDFQVIITPNGICYSFNIFTRSTIFADNVEHYSNFHTDRKLYDNYKQEKSVAVAPGQVKVQHFPMEADGLSMKLITDQSDLDNCSRTHSGYDVYIHDSHSIPISNAIKLLVNESKTIAVKPVVTTASNVIRKYSISRRHCYFEKEKYLKYFKVYTKTNCEMECWTNYTLKTCGCVHFSMPRINGTKICGHRSLTCAIKDAKLLAEGDAMITQMENGNISSMNENFQRLKRIMSSKYKNHLDNPLEILHCNCLPSCSNVEYKTETSQHAYDGTIWEREFKVSLNIDTRVHISNLNVYVDYDGVVSYDRKETYGPVDFLANFGGLLGLFCGFSLLSVIEILYFLSIRIICNKWSETKSQ